MLDMVFESEPIIYLPVNELPPTINMVWNTSLPYEKSESFVQVNAVFVGPTSIEKPLPDLYMTGGNISRMHPGYNYGLWRWKNDGTLWGKETCKGRISMSTIYWGGSKSRLGNLYIKTYFQNEVFKAAFIPYVLEPDEYYARPSNSLGSDPVWYEAYEVLTGEHFGLGVGIGSGFVGAKVLVDEIANRMIMATNRDIRVFNLITGAFLFETQTASIIIDICLEDDNRVYVLTTDRVLMLLDYLRNEMLGAVRMPSKNYSQQFGGSIYSIRMDWDRITRKLYVCEQTPDAENGDATINLVAYRTVPRPVRVTVPVPVSVPRQYGKTKVLSQVVGDMNEGVGGYVITAEVSGAGSLADLPLTDGQGRAFLDVALEGHPEYVGDSTVEAGSPLETPPHAGPVTVVCTARVPPTLKITP